MGAARAYASPVGAGITAGDGAALGMDDWMATGGQWATSGMMGGMHAGQSTGMMGSGWKQGSHFGMLFQFTSA